MKGEPKVNRPQLSSDMPHRDVLTPEALPPAFDSPGDLDIANIRVVSELTLVHQGDHFIALTWRPFGEEG